MPTYNYLKEWLNDPNFMRQFGHAEMNQLPAFGIIGNFDKDRSTLIKAIEDLFHIRFVNVKNSSVQSEPTLGNIVVLSADQDNFQFGEFLLKQSVPNLIINYSRSNLSELLDLPHKTNGGQRLRVSKYFIHQGHQSFGPLQGHAIRESLTRDVFAFSPDVGMIPLVTTQNQIVFGKIGDWYVSTIDLPTNWIDRRLKYYFSGHCFMGLLPLFWFLREYLGDLHFVPGKIRACCILDDLNIWSTRYGYVNYEKLVHSMEQRNYSVAIGLIPLDFKKVGQKPVRLFNQHKDRLSILIHGNNHTKYEMLKDRPEHECKELLEQALWKIHRLSVKSGLDISRAMILPYDEGSLESVRMMRQVGFEALFIEWFRLIKGVDYALSPNPLQEMFMSENSIEGFPVLNRHSIEAHYEERNWYDLVLFDAWLGKPIIPWTHHYYFKYGFEALEERVDFINKHIKPEWTSIQGVLEANYTVAHRGQSAYVNMYANSIRTDLPQGKNVVISKYGKDINVDEEILRINDEEIGWDIATPDFLSVLIWEHTRPIDRIVTGVQNITPRSHSSKRNIGATLRHSITEARDRTEPYFRWTDDFIENRVFSSKRS